MFYQTDIGGFKSALTPKEAAKDALDKGYKVAVLADEGMTAALDFVKACKKLGIKPVIGIVREVEGQKCVFVAKNHKGYRELCRYESEGYEGSIYESEYVIAVLAGPFGGKTKARYALTGAHSGQEHAIALPFEIANGKSPKDFYKAASLIALTRKTTFEKVCALGDFHFATSPLKTEVLDFKENISAFVSEIGEYDFGHPVPPDYKFTFETAKEINLSVSPDFKRAQNSLFRHLCEEGLRAKGLAGKKEYEQRLAFEMDVISQMGFDGYMLIVWDFINKAKETGIPVGPGRGSAAGSLVSYVLGITNLDPIKHSLLFERFLNPERVSLPDIDVDFCQDRREEAIRYVRNKYGEKNVAQIITVSGIGAKAAIRDGARIIQAPLYVADKMAKSLSPKTVKLEDEGMDEENLSPVERLVWRKALQLEGLRKNFGVHAAGIAISNDPLYENAPVYEVNGTKVVGFEGSSLEDVNLVKYDFLGLKTLTIIDNTVKAIKEIYGQNIEINSLSPTDDEVFKLISRGMTKGLFQIESDGMRDLAVKIRPENFEELVAMIALYRPGPMEAGMVDSFIRRKHGQEPVSYFFKSMEPALKPILEPTYGLIVYQEQVMQIVQAIAGFSLAEADMVRRAMGKKKPEEMEAIAGKFADGAVARGYDRNEAIQMFSMIEKFAGYGFNKSHSAAYAFITYQTAWLKRYYPTLFLASIMNGEIEKSVEDSKLPEYRLEAAKLGIKVEAPDIFSSPAYFKGVRYEDGTEKILFGLKAIKGVGKGAEIIEEARKRMKEEGIEIEDSGEFLKFLASPPKNLGIKKVGKRVVEALIMSGAADGHGWSRKDLADNMDAILKKRKEFSKAGVDMTTAEKIVLESEYLGVPMRSGFTDEESQIEGMAILLKKEKRKKRNGKGEYINASVYTVTRDAEGTLSTKVVKASDFNGHLEKFSEGDKCIVEIEFKGKYANIRRASFPRKRSKVKKAPDISGIPREDVDIEYPRYSYGPVVTDIADESLAPVSTETARLSSFYL